jgi:hypothetical protein
MNRTEQDEQAEFLASMLSRWLNERGYGVSLGLMRVYRFATGQLPDDPLMKTRADAWRVWNFARYYLSQFVDISDWRDIREFEDWLEDRLWEMEA